MFTDDSRGQSNVIGLALIFAVIIFSVSAIYVTGVGDITQYKNSLDARDSVHSMLYFTENQEDVYERNAPYRELSISLSGGGLNTGENTTMTVSCGGSGCGSGSTAHTFKSKPVQYTTPQVTATSELGAVIRTDTAGDDTSTIVESPPYKFSDEYVYLSVVEVRGDFGLSTDKSVRTVIEHTESDFVALNTTTDTTVTVRIETDPARADAWKRYFEDEGLTLTSATDVSNGVVEAEITTDEVVVRKTVVNVSAST